LKVKQFIKRALPNRAMRAYRGARGRWDRNDPLFDLAAEPDGPLASLYDEVKQLPGYFTYDDTVAFSLLLATQSISGVSGDVLEIGSYHGRSTAVIARYMNHGERLVVCDTFEESAEDTYPVPPTPDGLRRTLKRLAPNMDPGCLEIYACRSDELTLAGANLRFAHIDGGHSHEVALHDLRLAASHLSPHGIIAVDDYKHPQWPEVTTAVDAFMTESGFSVVADVNRWAEAGRKIYLTLVLIPGSSPSDLQVRNDDTLPKLGDESEQEIPVRQ